jgi:hypothetical protein
VQWTSSVLSLRCPRAAAIAPAIPANPPPGRARRRPPPQPRIHALVFSSGRRLAPHTGVRNRGIPLAPRLNPRVRGRPGRRRGRAIGALELSGPINGDVSLQDRVAPATTRVDRRRPPWSGESRVPYRRPSGATAPSGPGSSRYSFDGRRRILPASGPVLSAFRGAASQSANPMASA